MLILLKIEARPSGVSKEHYTRYGFVKNWPVPNSQSFFMRSGFARKKNESRRVMLLQLFVVIWAVQNHGKKETHLHNGYRITTTSNTSDMNTK